MPDPQWQVQPIIPAGGLVGLYGPPNEGKSFIALDLSLSIATGRPWLGHVINPEAQGMVLYVAAEGGVGIVKRVRAWLHHHHVTPQEARMGWLMEAMPVAGDSEDVDRLLARIHELHQEPVLIVIDTLARCFDGDENQQLDMGRFVKGVDRLRQACGATLVVVHHTRLDGERERGNTAFRGAADTMLSVSMNKANGLITVKCSKQKDAEAFDDLQMRLQTVPESDSCIVIPVGDARLYHSGTSEIVQAVLVHAREALTWTEWRLLCDIPVSNFKRAVNRLVRAGRVVKENGKYVVPGGDPDPRSDQ